MIKQYDQSDMISDKISNQSNKASNTIKINPEVVTLSVVLTKDSNGKRNVQEVDVRR